MKKIKHFFILLMMKLKKVPNPIINAQKYRFRGYSIGRTTYIYSTCFLDKTKGAKTGRLKCDIYKPLIHKALKRYAPNKLWS